MSAPVHCPTSHKCDPKATLNKKIQDCLVILYLVKKQLKKTDQQTTSWNNQFPAKVCMWALSQHCASNFLVECCLRCFWTTLTRQYSYAWLTQYCVGHFLHTSCQLVVKLSMLSKRLQKTAQEEILFKVVLIPNTAQVKTLSNTVHEKIQFNVVTILLLGQHCTGKNPVQCCLWDSRQHCTEKDSVTFCLTFNNFYFGPVISWQLVATSVMPTLPKFPRHCTRTILG